MKKIIITAIILLVGASVFLFMDNSVMADRINPFIQIDHYYTVVDTDGEYLGEDNIREGEDSYQYQFIGYNEDGDKQAITINVTKELKHGAYLNVTAKGNNGKTWFEVQADDIPEAAMKKLK